MDAQIKEVLAKLQTKYYVFEQIRSLQELKDAVEREFKDVPWDKIAIIPGDTSKVEFIVMQKSEVDLLYWKMKLAPIVSAAFEEKR